MYYDKGLVSKETLVLLHVCVCSCNVVMSWWPEMSFIAQFVYKNSIHACILFLFLMVGLITK